MAGNPLVPYQNTIIKIPSKEPANSLYKKNFTDVRSNNLKNSDRWHLAHNNNLNLLSKFNIVEDVLLKQGTKDKKSVHTDTNVSKNTKELNQNFNATIDYSSILKKTSPDVITKSKMEENDSIIIISDSESTESKSEEDIKCLSSRLLTGDNKRIKLQNKIPFTKNKASKDGEKLFIEAFSDTKKEKIQKNGEPNLEYFAIIEHQKQLKAKLSSNLIVQQQNNEQFSKEPSISLSNNQNLFDKIRNIGNDFNISNLISEEAYINHKNIFDTKEPSNKQVDIKDKESEDVTENKFLIIGQTKIKNVYYTLNKNFFYKIDDEYLILYSENNKIFKTRNEEFFFLTKLDKIVLMSKDLKEKLQIIKKILNQ
ncbi:hypothetical protein GVAV_003290 [Gurleya vavrai]